MISIASIEYPSSRFPEKKASATRYANKEIARFLCLPIWPAHSSMLGIITPNVQDRLAAEARIIHPNRAALSSPQPFG